MALEAINKTGGHRKTLFDLTLDEPCAISECIGPVIHNMNAISYRSAVGLRTEKDQPRAPGRTLVWNLCITWSRVAKFR